MPEGAAPRPLQLARGASIVIPAYNSAESLPVLVSRLEEVLGGRQQPFEIIIVDDGSQDKTWSVIEGLCSTHPAVYGIVLRRNYGQHNALLCAIRQANYDVTVTIDDDLQHPPEEIPKLLERLDSGFDVVYGAPLSQRHGLWRGLASTITKMALQSVMGAEVARKVSAFRAFRTATRESFAAYQGSLVSIDVLLTWGASRFDAVPVRHDPRRFGKSNYTLRMLTVHALNMVTGFSTRPLQLASLVGFAFTFGGFITLAYVVGRFLFLGNVVTGFPFLASIIAIFSGAQLFSLGIIGEYLARVHLRTMDRPPYSVRQVVGPPES